MNSGNEKTEPLDERAVRFLGAHHVLTLATAVNDRPYCANMFYAWMKEEGMFVFTSAADTRHIADVLSNRQVAGSVVLETKVVGNVQGIQFLGEMFRPEGELLERAKKRYLRRFPYAAAMGLELWVIEVNYLKMTDNRLGFGKKIIWKK